jgi:hypothetical protein
VPTDAAPKTTDQRVLKLLALVVTMLLIAELVTRALASGLPVPLQWQSYETQRKVQQIDALSKKGGAQVVFLGSSVIDVDVDPTVIDRELGGGVTSYNAGLASSIPRMSAAWAEGVVIPKLHPRVIVLGLISYDLGAEDPNRTDAYNALLASAGYRAVTGRNNVIQSVDRWLGTYSALWFHKYQLRDPATVLRAISGHPQPGDAAADDVDPTGRETDGQYSPFVDLTTVDVRHWSLGTKDTAAVEQLITYAKKRGITVVLVDMPVTGQFVAAMPHGAASYRTFRAGLATIGTRSSTKVLYYDGFGKDSLFGDNIHLNHDGAEQFSATLGRALRGVAH